MTVGAAYDNLSRKSAFDLSCLTTAVQDQYFTKKHVPVPETNNNNYGNNASWLPYYLQREKDDSKKTTVWIVVTICAGTLFIAATVFIVIMWRQEKKGEPIFRQSLLDPQQSEGKSEML